MKYDTAISISSNFFFSSPTPSLCLHGRGRRYKPFLRSRDDDAKSATGREGNEKVSHLFSNPYTASKCTYLLDPGIQRFQESCVYCADLYPFLWRQNIFPAKNGRNNKRFRRLGKQRARRGKENTQLGQSQQQKRDRCQEDEANFSSCLAFPESVRQFLQHQRRYNDTGCGAGVCARMRRNRRCHASHALVIMGRSGHMMEEGGGRMLYMRSCRRER